MFSVPAADATETAGVDRARFRWKRTTMVGTSSEVAATIPNAMTGHTVVMMVECWQTGNVFARVECQW